MRYLCIDLGDKRTGIAVGDDLTRLASPVAVIEVPRGREAGGALLDAIARVVETQLGPRDEIVIGLPLNMDGSEGDRTAIVRAFVESVRERLGRIVHLHDERLSSAQADWDMGRTGLTHKQKKAKRDALAAAAILRDFLNSHAPRP